MTCVCTKIRNSSASAGMETFYLSMSHFKVIGRQTTKPGTYIKCITFISSFLYYILACNKQLSSLISVFVLLLAFHTPRIFLNN